MPVSRVEWRLAFALAASVLVHAALLQAMQGAASRGGAPAAAPLMARLVPADTSAHMAPPLAPTAEVPVVEPAATALGVLPHTPREHAAPRRVDDVAVTRAAVKPTPALEPAPTPRVTEHPAFAAAPGNAAHTALSDPTYYGARSLDVYPRALSALNLGALFATGAPGQVRATVLIDETGTVNDVRAVQAAAADLEHAARDLLLRTRFTPAAKDGRVVRAQLLVSLEYGNAGAP